MSQPRFLYLSRADVERVGLDVKAILDLLERAFREKGEGRVELPPKPGIHPRPDAFLHAMAASIPGMQSAGLKWVAGFPENTARGLPYVSGLLILNDVETGLPLAVMDATWITAWRTGAATALVGPLPGACRVSRSPASSPAASRAARTSRRSRALFPLRKVYAYDRRRENQDRYVREMSERLGLEVVGVDEPRQAVAPADLVVTSGPILKHPTPTIERDWLREGAFASAVDYDSYWSGKALAQMDRIATDDHAQFRYTRETRLLPGDARALRRPRRARHRPQAGPAVRGASARSR